MSISQNDCAQAKVNILNLNNELILGAILHQNCLQITLQK